MKRVLLVALLIAVFVASAYTATVRVFTRGTGEVTVSATEKIAVFAPGTAKVYQRVGYPNVPGGWNLLQTVTGREYVSSAFTSNTRVRIEADAQGAWYAADATPDVLIPGPSVTAKAQRSPTAKTAAVTLTVMEMMGGIITGTHSEGSTQAYTLPTGTAMDASSDAVLGVDESFDWVIINLSDATADTVTVTANTAHTVVGTMIVQSANATTGLLYGNSVIFRTRKTAANTYVTYRIGG